MKQRVLIVDDERPLVEVLSLKLAHEGFDVVSVYSGIEALEILKKEYFDLVLLDLMMPQQDGFATLSEIKRLGLKTNVFVSSNLNQEEDIAKAKALGAVEYLVKSDINLSEIVEKVKSYLTQ